MSQKIGEMLMKNEMINRINELKIVAVIRGETKEEAQSIAKSAIEGGIKVIELTYTTPNVEEVFHELDNNPGVIVGAGTVLDEETARSAILRGAAFIVSPHFDEKVARLCNRYSVLYMPGCMTIKEIVTAMELGCSIVKLFPANAFQPNIIKAIKGPLPNVEIMPTGGVNLDNMNEWIGAGSFALGIGSDLNRAYKQNKEQGVMDLAKKYMEAVRRER